jgi:hypothetical protein
MQTRYPCSTLILAFDVTECLDLPILTNVRARYERSLGQTHLEFWSRPNVLAAPIGHGLNDMVGAFESGSCASRTWERGFVAHAPSLVCFRRPERTDRGG